MRKLLHLTALVAISTLAFGFLAVPSATAATKVKVGIAFDIGGRGDKSFGDSAAAGLDRAKKKFGLTAKEVTASVTGGDSEREAKLRLLAEAGYNPIIAIGFLYQTSLKKVASEYPNVQFGIVDTTVDLPNVSALLFSEEQGSYLVGVAAALASKSGKIGYIGGVRIPLLQKFEAGFVAGVKATNKSAKVDVKYVTEAPDFSGFADPAKAKVIANGMIDKGVDVIYSAAGGSGAGNFAAAADAAAAGKKVWTIGVDSDQYYSASSAQKKNMLTSMIKSVDVAVYDMISVAVAGSSLSEIIDPVEGIYGQRYNLALSGVGVSYAGGYITKYKTQIEKAKKAIIAGKIKVPTKP